MLPQRDKLGGLYTRACARGFSAAGCGRRRGSSSDIRQLESMPGTSVRAETQ